MSAQNFHFLFIILWSPTTMEEPRRSAACREGETETLKAIRSN